MKTSSSRAFIWMRAVALEQERKAAIIEERARLLAERKHAMHGFEA
jgi:hypothetical protein